MCVYFFDSKETLMGTGLGNKQWRNDRPRRPRGAGGAEHFGGARKEHFGGARRALITLIF